MKAPNNYSVGLSVTLESKSTKKAITDKHSSCQSRCGKTELEFVCPFRAIDWFIEPQLLSNTLQIKIAEELTNDNKMI
jgi:hypothetical protein